MRFIQTAIASIIVVTCGGTAPSGRRGSGVDPYHRRSRGSHRNPRTGVASAPSSRDASPWDRGGDTSESRSRVIGSADHLPDGDELADAGTSRFAFVHNIVLGRDPDDSDSISRSLSESRRELEDNKPIFHYDPRNGDDSDIIPSRSSISSQETILGHMSDGYSIPSSVSTVPVGFADNIPESVVLNRFGPGDGQLLPHMGHTNQVASLVDNGFARVEESTRNGGIGQSEAIEYVPVHPQHGGVDDVGDLEDMEDLEESQLQPRRRHSAPSKIITNNGMDD